MIITSIERSLSATLLQLQQVLSELSNDEYRKSLPIISNASIGQHTRHIIEFFDVLLDGYESGLVCYDKRNRNQVLETSRDLAHHQLAWIVGNISRDDKDLLLAGSYLDDDNDETSVRSSYYRELVYNLEHAIHHMAMIKIAMTESTNVVPSNDFGVAPATIKFRKPKQSLSS